MRRSHRMAFGAALAGDGAVFRLWAPDAADNIMLHLPGRPDVALTRQAQGWGEVFVAGVAAGARYGFRIGDHLVPDPASRFQPDDVHSLSEIIDPEAYDWQDDGWRGRPWHDAVICELHVGTFTPEGSFRAAIARLPALAEMGFTALQLMPVADFAGQRGWGYDGVLWFAPDSSYGRPEDLKALVDAAHGLGLMVFLDVVYNHFGPEGNYLGLTAKRFLTDRHHTPWGQAINYDGADARPVRDFVIANALYWLEEFHFDGLRLDAVHAIVDDSRPHILDELAERIRTAITDRPVHLVLENDANAVGVLARDGVGQALRYTAQWNDDIHHALHRLLTGEDGGYYQDYGPDPLDHLCRCLAEGFAYQGEASPHRQGAVRGDPSRALSPLAFVSFLQNHDQIGNRALGERLHALAPAEAVRAAIALLLLAPQPPLLFMGEEWGASTPFQYFCDVEPGLAQAVRRGRRQEFQHFPQFQGAGARKIPDPCGLSSFTRSKLNWDEARRAPFADRLALTRHLLALRRSEIVPRLAGISGGRAQAGRIGPRALAAQWVLGDGTTLRGRANFSPEPLTGIIPEKGRLLYSTHGNSGQGEFGLAGWGVDWHLDETALATTGE